MAGQKCIEIPQPEEYNGCSMKTAPRPGEGRAGEMKKYGKLILAVLGVYVLLLLLLLAAEAGQPGASIRSFGDAVWYSLITMTTVGYGDMAPVTPVGRVLGMVFALCSIGVLTALISFGLRLLGGEFLPRLRLRLNRGRPWYAFTESNADTRALADAIAKEEKNALMIYAPGPEQPGRSGKDPCLRFTPEELAALRRGTEGLTVFFMSGEAAANYAAALAAAEKGIRSCCMADIRAGKLPAGLQVFSPLEAMSRCYWKEHPLRAAERRIVLIGEGRQTAALLERALLTNILPGESRTEYHVFGGAEEFAALHPEIVKALDGHDPGEDLLALHGEAWESARELLGQADRIILCFGDDRGSFEAYERLGNWIPATAEIHLRLAQPVPGAVCFGSREESMRPEFVMKDELNRRAVLMNEIYNENAAQPVAWEELSAFLRQSNIAAADHLIVKARWLLGDESLTELSPELLRRAYERFREEYARRPDVLLEAEHRRWMRFHQMYNWRYAPERDNARRLHPLLLPYGELSEEVRRRDAYAWEMLGRLADA